MEIQLSWKLGVFCSHLISHYNSFSWLHCPHFKKEETKPQEVKALDYTARNDREKSNFRNLINTASDTCQHGQ